MSSAHPPDRKLGKLFGAKKAASEGAPAPGGAGGKNPQPVSVLEIGLLVLALILFCDIIKAATGR